MTYSSSVAMSRRQYARKNQNVVSFAERTKALGPISSAIILIVLFCLIGLLYLTQVTRTSSFGYTIDDLQQKQSQLKTQKTDLEITAARLQSLDRVAASEAAKKLVSAAPSGTLQ